MSKDDPQDQPTAHHEALRSGRRESELAAARALQSTPRFQALIARQQRLAMRGVPALVLLDASLPEGVLAQIRLGQRGRLRRFIVMSRQQFSDEGFDRASLLVDKLDRMHLDDERLTSATLYSDGRYTADVAGLGERTGIHAPRFIGAGFDETMSRELLSEAAKRTPEEVPEFGPGRVLHLR